MTDSVPDPDLDRAGLSATGQTADDLQVGNSRAGTTYDDPGGPGTAHRETTSGDPDADVGQPAAPAGADGPSQERSADSADEE